MKQILVIGNGESRRPVNIDQIKQNYITIGCNAIHRDVSVDHLVCCDQRMVREAILNFANKKIYTRSDWYKSFQKFPTVLELPSLPYIGNMRADEPFHWGSGPYAVLLAAQLGDTVSLIGFDLIGNGQLVNNIYKGTENYSSADSHAVDPSYWVYQISKVFELFPDKYFIIYNKEDWAMPDSWKLGNVEFKNIDTLKDFL